MAHIIQNFQDILSKAPHFWDIHVSFPRGLHPPHLQVLHFPGPFATQLPDVADRQPSRKELCELTGQEPLSCAKIQILGAGETQRKSDTNFKTRWACWSVAYIYIFLQYTHKNWALKNLDF